MDHPLRFGVVGAGYFGKNYIRILQDMPGVELSALADPSPDFEKNIPMLSPTVKRFTDANTLISDPEIDCVVIATPAISHSALIVAALRAGKHTLVEKPMAMNMREAEEIRGTVEESGRIFMVGHQYLYHDYVRHLKSEIDKDVIGRPRYVLAENFYFGPIRSDIGCFWETATHELAIIDYLFSPGTITDARGTKVDFSGSGRDDFASATITFESGLVAAITVSWFAPEKIRRMTVTGERGMAVFDDRREEKLKLFLHPYPEALKGGGVASQFLEFKEGEIKVPAPDAREPLRNQLEHFISSVRTGMEPESGIAHGMRVTKMLDTISRQMQ